MHLIALKLHFLIFLYGFIVTYIAWKWLKINDFALYSVLSVWSLNKKMELGNPAFMRVSGLFVCGVSTVWVQNYYFEIKNTETMLASSPRKKPTFFCSSGLLYAIDRKKSRYICDIYCKSSLQFLLQNCSFLLWYCFFESTLYALTFVHWITNVGYQYRTV